MLGKISDFIDRLSLLIPQLENSSLSHSALFPAPQYHFSSFNCPSKEGTFRIASVLDISQALRKINRKSLQPSQLS